MSLRGVPSRLGGTTKQSPAITEGDRHVAELILSVAEGLAMTLVY